MLGKGVGLGLGLGLGCIRGGVQWMSQSECQRRVRGRVGEYVSG